MDYKRKCMWLRDEVDVQTMRGETLCVVKWEPVNEGERALAQELLNKDADVEVGAYGAVTRSRIEKWVAFVNEATLNTWNEETITVARFRVNGVFRLLAKPETLYELFGCEDIIMRIQDIKIDADLRDAKAW